MMAEKITFLQMHNTILQRVISKCKNDKHLKNEIGKVLAPTSPPPPHTHTHSHKPPV